MSDSDLDFNRDEEYSHQDGASSYEDEENSHGDIGFIQVVNIWRIDKFSSYRNMHAGSRIVSPKFSTADINGPNVDFQLALSPNGVISNENNYLALSLVLKSLNNLKVQYKFCAIDKNKEVLNTVEGEHFFQSLHDDEVVCPKFINKEWIMDNERGLLVYDKFCILCKINFDTEIEFLNSEDTLGLSNDLQFLHENPDFSDVKLMASKEVFHVHKNILASRSSVFAAMFRHNMKENMNNIVPINDVNSEVLKEMLYYIYTGRIKDVGMHMAQDLLIVADKYDMQGLKKISGSIIKKNLNIDNAVNVLILADSYNATMLKESVHSFITENIKNIMETQGFKDAENSYSHLIINTLCTIIKKRDY